MDLIIVLIIIAITAILTYSTTCLMLKHKAKKYNCCPFQNACQIYNERQTKEAANRVVKLLIENINEDTAYKSALKNFLKDTNQ